MPSKSGEAQLAESKAAQQQIAEEIAAEEATLEHAKSQYDRSIGLRESGAISDQEFIRLHSQYNAQVSKIGALKMRQAAARQLAAKYEADLRASKEHMLLRTEERRKLDRAHASVLQAEAALNQAKTVLQEARLRLERMDIRSTMDGIVMSRLTEPGSKVVMISDNPVRRRSWRCTTPNECRCVWMSH